MIDKEQNRQRSQLFVVARSILATAGLVGQGQLSKVATYGRPTVFFLDKSSLCMRQATAELSCLTGKGEQSEGMVPPTGRGAGDRPHQTCWDIFIIPPGVYSFQAEFVNKFNPEKTIIV